MATEEHPPQTAGELLDALAEFERWLADGLIGIYEIRWTYERLIKLLRLQQAQIEQLRADADQAATRPRSRRPMASSESLIEPADGY